jgi:glycosyltransferase involved in cell wall biosynthesis
MNQNNIIYISAIPQNETNDFITNTAKCLSKDAKVIHFTMGWEEAQSISFRQLFVLKYLHRVIQNIYALFFSNLTNWIFFEPLPLNRFQFIYLLNRRLNLMLIKSALRTRGKTIVILCRPSKEVKKVVEYIQPDLIVGDSWDIWPPKDIALSRAFLPITMTNLPILYKKYLSYYKNVYLISGGFYTTHTLQALYKTKFARANTKNILIIGTLSWRMNFTLLFELVKKMSDYTFTIVGVESLKPIKGPEEWNRLNASAGKIWEQIKGMNNVTFIPIKNQTMIPLLHLKVSVGLITYDPDGRECFYLNKYCNPIKFYQYLALGIPVVSTKLRNLLPYQSRYIRFGDTIDELITQIKLAATLTVPQLTRIQMYKIAEVQTSETKAQEIQKIIALKLQGKDKY